MTMMTSRRNLLKGMGHLGVAGVSSALFPSWMPKLVFSPVRQNNAPGQRDVLVAIFQRGGMDGLNAVVPFGEGGLYYDRRRTIAIPEPGVSELSAIDLDGHFGLHPALAPLKNIWDANHLAIIHGAGSPDPTRSHFDAMEYMERGTPGVRSTTAGWINRHLLSASWQNDSPFRAVGIGAMVQGSLRGPVSALAMRSIVDFHLQGREDQIAQIQSTLSSLYNVDAPSDMMSAAAGEVFETVDLLSQMANLEYTPANGAEYPESDFGMALRQVAQLIKSDVGLEVAAVDIGGWDTHENQGGAEGEFAYLLGNFGAALGAFYTDMGDAMSGVTVVTMSEFGRRVQENASSGTDHGHGNVMMVMGGGASSGVYGRWIGLEEDNLDEGDLAVTTDYRDVLTEILAKRLGNNALDQIFPGYALNPLNIFQAR
ncbi:MAG: DUF1501 domain-containing protein [Pleurocapsa minor GSE-CHR-MK-17-07R]|jgi:uncharacterized protein (DUF1501 family)|nr:DUF1501 domain-containing protein [Pleurocapsa minor GSE-CHR-MK 17-07R]